MSKNRSKKTIKKRTFAEKYKSEIIFLSLTMLAFFMKLLLSTETTYEDYFNYIFQYSSVGFKQDLFVSSFVSTLSGLVSIRDTAFFSAVFVFIALIFTSYFTIKTIQRYQEKTAFTKAIYFFVIFECILIYLNKVNLDSCLIIGVILMILSMKKDSLKFLVPILSAFAVMTKLSYFYTYFIVVLMSMFLIFSKEKSHETIRKNKIISGITIALTTLLYGSFQFLSKPLSDTQIDATYTKLYYKTSVFIDKDRFSFVFGNNFAQKFKELRVTDFGARAGSVFSTASPALALIILALVLYVMVYKKSKNNSIKIISALSFVLPFVSIGIALFFKISIISTVCFTLFYLYGLLIILSRFGDEKIFAQFCAFTNAHTFFIMLVLMACSAMFIFSKSIFNVSIVQFFETWWMPY